MRLPHLAESFTDSQIAIIYIGKYGIDRANDLIGYVQAMAIPANANPFEYLWHVANLEVYLVDTGISSNYYIQRFTACLFAAGAKQITYITKKTEPTIFKRRLK